MILQVCIPIGDVLTGISFPSQKPNSFPLKADAFCFFLTECVFSAAGPHQPTLLLWYAKLDIADTAQLYSDRKLSLRSSELCKGRQPRRVE